MHDVIIIELDDWQIWFVNNVCTFSHHRMDDMDILELGRKLKDFTYAHVWTETFVTHDREEELFHHVRELDELEPILEKMTTEEYGKFLTQVDEWKR